MKKIVNLTLTLIMCSLLCSCGDASNSSDIDAEIPSNALYINTGENIYETGMIYGNNDGVNMYLDFETMEKTILCSLPNCNHTVSDCIAKIIGETPIIYNDYIYFFDVKDGVNETTDGREFYIDSKLKKVSLTTSEIEQVSEFTDCEPREYDGCVIIDNVLYFCGDNMNPTKDEYGGISYGNGGGIHYLCSIDLDSGKYTNYGSIYDDDKQYESAGMSSSAKIKGYYDSKIYIKYSFMKEYIESTDIDTRDKFTILNFEFDPTTKEIKESDLPSASFMNNDAYLCSNYPEESSNLNVNGETYTFDGLDVNLIGKYFNNKVFMYDRWYDITDYSEHSLGEYKGWKVMTMYNDCYILSNETGTKFIKLTEEELLALDKE